MRLTPNISELLAAAGISKDVELRLGEAEQNLKLIVQQTARIAQLLEEIKNRLPDE